MSSRQGILFVASSTKIGGGTRVLMDLMLRVRPRYRPYLVVPGDGPLSEWAAASGIPHEIVRSAKGGYGAGRWSMIRYALALVRIIRAQRIGIVHAEGPICYRPVGLAGAIARIPRICHLGFPPGPNELSWNFRFGPDLVIACYQGQMEQVRGEIARLRPRCSVIAITNGVDLGRFRPRDGQDDVSRWRFGAGRVVMILGHLSDVKGYPTFLRSAALLKKAIGDCAFVAVGGETIQAGFKTELLRQAESLGVKDDVHFIGWQNDVAPVLRAADVVALPSLDEGLPLAVLEAMASGVPVVATPVGGVPEAVVDGVTGRLVPPENPGALADAIRHLLSDPQLLRSMGDEARKRAEQQYSLDRHAELTMVAYERLLSAPAY